LRPGGARRAPQALSEPLHRYQPMPPTVHLPRNSTFEWEQAEIGLYDQPPPCKGDPLPSPSSITALDELGTAVPAELVTPVSDKPPSLGERVFALAEEGDAAADQLHAVLQWEQKAACFVSPVRGRTPLLAACKYGHVRCAAMLLKAGASVNASNVAGVTPLHVAAAGSNVECIQLLLRSGASRKLKDNSGRTALQWAQEAGTVAAVDALDSSVAASQTLNALAVAPARLLLLWLLGAAGAHGWCHRSAALCTAMRTLGLPPPLRLAISLPVLSVAAAALLALALAAAVNLSSSAACCAAQSSRQPPRGPLSRLFDWLLELPRGLVEASWAATLLWLSFAGLSMLLLTGAVAVAEGSMGVVDVC